MRRRLFLRASLASAGAFALDPSSVARLLAQGRCPDDRPAGSLLETLPLTGDRPRDTPFGEAVGGPGLDTRVFTDLSLITPDRLLTPSDRVFVRTAPPPGVSDRQPNWAVSLPAGSTPSKLDLGSLRRRARPMGVHLIECAGNNDPNNFGLLSAADWTGVPLQDIVTPLAPTPGGAYGVLVTGEDDETRRARSSVPGASWILPLADLPRLGAFLATEMNGEPLPVGHGAPVRLVVPGWYGCSWIKWVRDIRLVGPDAPVTSQMAEFAGRTHQGGRPALARDYEPPVIDVAATPIRVERRLVGGAVEHHVVGIVWGGARPVTTLEIRFGPRDPWRPLDVCPPPTSTRAWALWTYRWTPPAPGSYSISLRCPDPDVRTRRLDLFFYTRRVSIERLTLGD